MNEDEDDYEEENFCYSYKWTSLLHTFRTFVTIYPHREIIYAFYLLFCVLPRYMLEVLCIVGWSYRGCN